MDFFISSGRDKIQRLEQAQINSVQYVWSLLNYFKSLLSSFNPVPLLHVISIIYLWKIGENSIHLFVKTLEILDIRGWLKHKSTEECKDNHFYRSRIVMFVLSHIAFHIFTCTTYFQEIKKKDIYVDIFVYIFHPKYLKHNLLSYIYIIFISKNKRAPQGWFYTVWLKCRNGVKDAETLGN